MIRQRTRSWIAAALLGAVCAGCGPDLPTQPGPPPGVRFLQVTGDWEYFASEMRLAGSTGAAPCQIRDVTLSITQIRRAGAFSGRASPGQLTCGGELSFLSGPLTDYPVGNGYTFNQYISFDLGTPDWRHEGLVATEDSVWGVSMSGSFRLRSGGLLFDGKFRASRRPGR